MSNAAYGASSALDPFFGVVMEGLSPYVDGAHYFDALADDVLFEFRYRIPGWPPEVRGRFEFMSLYSGYGDNIRLERGDALLVHPSSDGSVVTVEYEVHGMILRTGLAYENRFVSVAFIEGRKIVRWRDYMDSLAAWTALTGGA